MVQVKISTVHFVCFFLNRLWTDTRDLLDWVNHFQMNLRYTKVCVCVCVCVGGGGGGVGYHFILLNFVKSKLAKMVRRSNFHCSFSLLVLTVIRFLSAD